MASPGKWHRRAAKAMSSRALTRLFQLTRFHGSVGQVAEWLKAPVSKTGIPFTRYREFESLPVRSTDPSVHAPAEGVLGILRGTALTAANLGAALLSGWVAEWFKAHAWKACIRQKRIGGSNPPPSVRPVSTSVCWRGFTFPGKSASAVRSCCPFACRNVRTAKRTSRQSSSMVPPASVRTRS